MMHYRIAVTSSDDAIADRSRDGIACIGVARACAVEMLLGAAREPPPAGARRTIAVTVSGEGGVFYRDDVTVWGRSADDAAVGRAIGAIAQAFYSPGQLPV